jgi:hypothetical protein
VGSITLWVQVVDAQTGATVGETAQVGSEVVAPAFSVRFNPPAGQGRIGQEVIAGVVATPEIPASLIDYRWLEPPTSNRREATQNASEIGFVPRDAKPVVLQALARVPGHGDDLGTIDASYTAVAYPVKVSVEERGPKPMVWDPAKGGLMPAPKGAYAADEAVGLRAELEGEPRPREVRWRWTVNDGTTISNPISQTPTVSRHEPGLISARAEALGRGGRLARLRRERLGYVLQTGGLLPFLSVTWPSPRSSTVPSRPTSASASGSATCRRRCWAWPR